MHAINERMRAYWLEPTVGVVVAILVVVAGLSLRGYDQPSTIKGTQWITPPIANFLNAGDTTYLVLVAVALGVMFAGVTGVIHAVVRATPVHTRR